MAEHDMDSAEQEFLAWEERSMEMDSLRTEEDFGPLLDIDPTDPDTQAWLFEQGEDRIKRYMR